MDNHPNMTATISHELRIPITGILGMVNFLSKTLVIPQQEEYLQNIRNSAIRLLELEDKLHKIYSLPKKSSNACPFLRGCVIKN